MYESPLNIIYGEIQTKIIEERENQAIQALQNYGISVDKEELIKALMYDRQQYEKGYADAKAEEKWIPCNERLPEERGFYLVSVGAPYKTVRVYEYKPCEGYENENLWKNDDGSYCFNWFVEAWMPLPEPYAER